MNFLQITMLVTYAYLSLIPLKLFGVINWSWLAIFSPIIILLCLLAVYSVVMLIIYFIAKHFFNASK